MEKTEQMADLIVEKVFRLFHKDVYTWAYRFVKDGDRAKDVEQDVFIRFDKELIEAQTSWIQRIFRVCLMIMGLETSPFKDRDFLKFLLCLLDKTAKNEDWDEQDHQRISTWLYRTTVNRCWNSLRETNTRYKYYDAFRQEMERESLPATETAVEQLEEQLEELILWQAMSCLSKEHRFVLVLWIKGITTKEVAEILTQINEKQVSQELVRAWRSRAIKELRKGLKKLGWKDSDIPKPATDATVEQVKEQLIWWQAMSCLSKEDRFVLVLWAKGRTTEEIAEILGRPENKMVSPDAIQAQLQCAKEKLWEELGKLGWKDFGKDFDRVDMDLPSVVLKKLGWGEI